MINLKPQTDCFKIIFLPEKTRFGNRISINNSYFIADSLFWLKPILWSKTCCIPKQSSWIFILKSPNKKHAIPETDAATVRPMKGFIFIILCSLWFTQSCLAFFLLKTRFYYITWHVIITPNNGTEFFDIPRLLRTNSSDWFVDDLTLWESMLKTSAAERSAWGERSFSLSFLGFETWAWNMKYNDFDEMIFMWSVRKIGFSKVLICHKSS